jgi:hypothetical protein
MSDQDDRRRDHIHLIRRIARIWSILSIAFFLVMLVGEVLFPHADATFSTRDLIAFQFFPIGTFVGMLIAWRRELIGGSVTIGSMLAFYLWLRLMDGQFPRGPLFLLIIAPGLLFLLVWAMERQEEQAATP